MNFTLAGPALARPCAQTSSTSLSAGVLPSTICQRCRFNQQSVLQRTFIASGRRITLASRLPNRRATVTVLASAEGAVDVDVEEDAMDRMEKSLEATKRTFNTVRTGRANPSMLDRVEVDYYGALTPLKALAGISVPESSMLVIQPYDKGSIPAIEKAIQQSDLGLTPNNDGNVIRLNVPQLTQERRKEMVKTVAKLGEEGKVAIRNVRRDAMKTVGGLAKANTIGEDEEKSLEKAIQDLTDDYVKQIDGMVKQKTEELTKV